MTKRMGLMALGLSMVLLSGCGSNDNPGDEGSGPNTPDEVASSIVGTWATGCINHDGESDSEILIFNADGTGSFEGTEYSGADCNPDDEVDYDNDSFSYVLGEATKGSNDEDAVEIDFILPGVTYYSMVHFDENKLLIGDGDGDDTEDNRANEFDVEWGFTRQ